MQATLNRLSRLYMYMYIYIYTHTHIYTHTYSFMYALIVIQEKEATNFKENGQYKECWMVQNDVI